MKKYLALLLLIAFTAVPVYAASQSIWGSTDRGPVVSTYRIPVDTSSNSGPGYITPAELQTFYGTTLGTGLTITQGTANATPLLPGSSSLFLQTFPNIYTGSHTVSATESAGVDICNKSSAMTMTIPQAGTTGFLSGTTYSFLNINSGACTLTTTTSLFHGMPLTSSNIVLQQYGYATCVSDGTDYHCSGSENPSFATPVSSANGGTGIANTATLTLGSSNVNLATLGTGIVKNTTTIGALSNATSTDVIGLFSTCSGTQYLGADGACHTASGGSGGGGTLNYSDNGVTLTANTYFAPPGGGGIPQTTEANVDVAAPAAATISNLQVSVSAAPGAGNSYAITFRDAGSDTALTCTISGASATSCSDTTHSVNISAGDLIDWKVVSAGTIATTPTLTITAANGTSNVGVTSITATAPLTGGTITTTGTVGLSGSLSQIMPSSSYTTDTAGNLFPYVYAGGGGNASVHDAGWGVAASLGSDVTLEMRFQMPPTIPAGTFKLVSYCMANATSGVAKYTPSDAMVASGSSPSGATLTADTQVSQTWSAVDVYVVNKTTLSGTPAANNVSVVAVTFNHTGWTLAQIMSCRWVELWE